MNQQEVEKVLQKAAEMKVFCEYGQRTIPVLDEIAGFLNEISPAIEDLKAVLEVAMTNIPKAAGQLGRVTEATEQASTQILNTLDKMVATLDQVITSVSSGMIASDLGVATNKMAGIVKTLVEKSGWDADIVELAEAWAAHLRSMKMSGPTSNLERLLKDLQDDCTEIMMALSSTLVLSWVRSRQLLKSCESSQPDSSTFRQFSRSPSISHFRVIRKS